ncbi:MAG TPA: DNA polymerase III subunit alpha [Alphaproteobacteria bacterium]
MSTQPFIHLRVHSAYSLAEGAIKIDKALDMCVHYNMPAMAITDTNNLFGAMEHSNAALKKGVQPIIGCQLDLKYNDKAEGRDNGAPKLSRRDIAPIVVLVQNAIGYENLSKLVSAAYIDKQAHETFSVSTEQLLKHSEGLILLTGGAHGHIARFLENGRREQAELFLKTLHESFGNRLYVELTRHGEWDKATDQMTIALAYDHNIPVVATNNCYFIKPDFYEAHDALLCIADGRYITENDRRRETPDHYFKSPDEMTTLFADVPEAILNTVQIAKRCHFYIKKINPQLPAFPTEAGRTEDEELVHIAEEGLKARLEKYVLPQTPPEKHAETIKEYTDRLHVELPIILKMGFAGYFLIVADFIGWAKQQNIPVGPGRGSGAGSIVAWSMDITDVDPMPYRLLFERFLNPERVSMPDFDIDFCQARRDEVISYVQKKYGKDRVAQIITFGKLQARAVVRDVGRVLQMPYGQVDKISKMIPQNPANPVTLQEAINTDPEFDRLRKAEESVDRLLTIALKLEGLYRHASTHAAGIVIGNKPLPEIVPLYRDPRSDMPATQFNLKYIEDTGLVKFDFLGLKTLTVLQAALENIKETEDVDIDLLALPLEDKKTYDLIAAGQTTGIFQFEGSGMQDTMRKVKPTRIEDLIAIASLYRPGPMDQIPQYAKVKHGEAQADYPHPLLEPILSETHGIMVYQEQVMEIAKVLSGYTLGGADLLRRAMGKKIKEEMDAQRERFVQGAAETNKVPADQANMIFDLVAKFAGYGFNKSHAAAYALIAYQTGYLKANYPVEFMAALMTLDLGNTDKINFYLQDLKRLNITLLPPDINHSFAHFAVEQTDEGKAIRYALAGLKGIGEQAITELVTEREANGIFADLDDLAQRVNAKSFTRKQFEILVAAGAFDSFGYRRSQLHDAADRILAMAQRRVDDQISGQVSLFAATPQALVQERITFRDLPEWVALEKIQNEYDAVGFYLTAHPLDTYADWLKEKKFLNFQQLLKAGVPIPSVKMAGVVLKRQERRSERGRYAFVTFSDSTGVFDVAVYTEPLMQFRPILETGNILAMQMEVSWREEEPRLILRHASLLDTSMTSSVNHLQLRVGAINVKEGEVDRRLDQIASFFTRCSAGPVKVDMTLALGDRLVKMHLNQTISLKDADLGVLKNIPDVTYKVQ